MQEQLPHIRASQQAWSIFLQGNAVHPDDVRRCTLERYLHVRWQAGEKDLDELTCSGLSYLARLDAVSEQW